jgi:hypothetical protein
LNLIYKAVEAKLATAGIDWVKVHSLSVDKQSKTASATLALEGEPDPVAILVTYSLETDHLLVLTIEATRPWLTKALNLALTHQGGRLPIPSGLEGSMVRMLL